jgi:hypothetical protein
MLDLLWKLVGRKKSSASDESRAAFIRELGKTELFFLRALHGDGIPTNELTKERLLAEFRREMEAARDKEGFRTFVYERNGNRVLPFFTSEEKAQMFCGEYSKQQNRVYPFQVVSISPITTPVVVMVLLVNGDVLILNDRCPDESVISTSDKARMRLWANPA